MGVFRIRILLQADFQLSFEFDGVQSPVSAWNRRLETLRGSRETSSASDIFVLNDVDFPTIVGEVSSYSLSLQSKNR